MASRLPTTSGFYKYAQLSQRNTQYAKRMNLLKSKIFNEVSRPVEPGSTSANILKSFATKPIDVDPGVVDFYDYCRHPQTDDLIKLLRGYGLFRDEHADWAEEMERLRELRGKGTKAFYDRHHQK